MAASPAVTVMSTDVATRIIYIIDSYADYFLSSLINQLIISALIAVSRGWCAGLVPASDRSLNGPPETIQEDFYCEGAAGSVNNINS